MPCGKGHIDQYPSGDCKQCAKDRAARRKQKDPERIKAENRAYYHRVGKLKYPARWANHLKNAYGLTVERYEEMVRQQEGRCKVCCLIPAHKLCVDHDHKTNKVRGLLCRPCNIILGFLRDSIELFPKIKAYLEAYRD